MRTIHLAGAGRGGTRRHSVCAFVVKSGFALPALASTPPALPQETVAGAWIVRRIHARIERAQLGRVAVHDGADQRPGRVVLAAVAAGVAHVANLGFVQVREFVLLGLRTEPQFVDMVDDLPQVVARLNLVFDLSENLTDLVFDGVWA